MISESFWSNGEDPMVKNKMLGVAVLISFSAFAEVQTYSIQDYGKKFATGLVRTADSTKFIQFAPRKSFRMKNVPIPGKYSMRGIAGPVEDQMNCGSCWDFALTSVLRGTMKMANKDPGRLSFNYLLNCATEMWGCEGGDFMAAQHFLTYSSTPKKGAPLYGTDGPYIAREGTCEKKPVKGTSSMFYFLGTDGGSFPQGTAPSFKDMAYVLGVLHKPVAIDVAVDDEWQKYSGGVYNGCTDNDPKDINHMVSLEGYDCEKSVDANGNCVFDANGNLPPGVGKWIIRNSWGTTWGDNGYITTKATNKKGERCNAVVTDALYYDVK